jgi:hypothetical protein
VENRSPVISFGISSGDKRSAYWRVRSGMKPELFIEREDHGALWHLSLHESGRWHLKITNEARVHWVRPAEMVPGYIRGVGIVMPYMVTYKDDAAPAGVELVPIEPHSDPMTFSLFIEKPGANLDGWPGKNAMGHRSGWPPASCRRRPDLLRRRPPGRAWTCLLALFASHRRSAGLDA